jgi:hypothetical protein
MAAGYGRRSIRSATPHALHDSHISGRQRVSEGPDPHLPQRPEIYPVVRPGGLGERPTAGWHDKFRGGASDPSQREPRPEAGGGVAPCDTPACPRPTPRVRGGRTTDVQQPPGQPGCGVAHLQQANPSPEADTAMAYIRVTTALVEERSAASKSAASTLSRHSRSRSDRSAHSKLPTIQEEVNQPRANAAPGVDLHANIDKNRRGRDARDYIVQRHCEHEE